MHEDYAGCSCMRLSGGDAVEVSGLLPTATHSQEIKMAIRANWEIATLVKVRVLRKTGIGAVTFLVLDLVGGLNSLLAHAFEGKTRIVWIKVPSGRTSTRCSD